MRTFARVFVAICACSMAAACASAPISMTGNSLVNIGSTAETSRWQTALHSASDRLADTFVSRGWSSASNAMGSARRWVGRLAGREDEEQVPSDPVETYLTLHTDETVPPEQHMQHVRADLEEAIALSRDVDFAARELILSGDNFSRSSLARDIETVEAAIGHTRQALTVFDVAIDQLSDELDEQQIALLRERHAELDARSSQLSDRADDIADMRWDERFLLHG